MRNRDHAISRTKARVTSGEPAGAFKLLRLDGSGTSLGSQSDALTPRRLDSTFP